MLQAALLKFSKVAAILDQVQAKQGPKDGNRISTNVWVALALYLHSLIAAIDAQAQLKQHHQGLQYQDCSHSTTIVQGTLLELGAMGSNRRGMMASRNGVGLADDRS